MWSLGFSFPLTAALLRCSESEIDKKWCFLTIFTNLRTVGRLAGPSLAREARWPSPSCRVRTPRIVKTQHGTVANDTVGSASTVWYPRYS